jgi:hypothetical protein
MTGLPIIVVAGVLGIASDFNGFGEAAAGFVFLMFPAVLGALSASGPHRELARSTR